MRTQTVGKSRLRNTGLGPGAQTLDGCSVEFYRRLPPGQEVCKVMEARPPPASLLELGAGCGRLTQPLVEAGYEVTAVDNSIEMLAHIDCARTVTSDIESLRLGDSFDIVLLASRVLNCPADEVRDAMLAAARAHLKVGDVFLLEVHSSSILDVQTGTSSKNEHYGARIVSSEIDGTRAKVTIEYTIEDDVWQHSFETEYLSPERLESSLRKRGFKMAGWMDSEQSWLKAVAV